MFSPAKSDLLNEEMDVSDVNQPTNVVALHPVSSDTSSDVASEKLITVSDFCQQHHITSDQFLALRRKAARKHPAIDFKPIREGSRTFWVQNAAILTQMIDEGAVEPKPESKKSKAAEAIDGEFVQELADGSALVKRRQSVEVSLVPLESPKTREFIELDATPLQQLNASLRADQTATKEAHTLTRLAQVADEALVEREQEDLVRLLIRQGYTKEQAIVIASGIKKG